MRSNRFDDRRRASWVLNFSVSMVFVSVAGAPRPLVAADPLPPTTPITVILPHELESLRERLSTDVQDAVGSATAFFMRYGFDVVADTAIDSAYIFATVASARSQCAARFGVPEEAVPATFSGTVDGSVLLAVAPELFREIYSDLYGAGRWSANEHRALLVHELAHRFHALVAVELSGSEDGMGPRWFFEGLATACAGQFDDSAGASPLSLAEMTHYIEADDQGALPSPAYPIYRKMFDTAARKMTVHWLITHAGDSAFVPQVLDAFGEDED